MENKQPAKQLWDDKPDWLPYKEVIILVYLINKQKKNYQRYIIQGKNKIYLFRLIK